MDVEHLSRLQFAFTIAFHYIYPPLSIGLGVILVVMEGMSYADAAQVLECSEGTVGWRMHEARRKLRDRLGHHLEDAPAGGQG